METQTLSQLDPDRLGHAQQELQLLSDLITQIDQTVDLATFKTDREQLKAVAPDRLEMAIQSITEYRQLLQSAIEKEIDIYDSRSFVSHFLDRLGLNCPTDFLESLTKDREVIEAYNFENVQIFRNLTFMRICGYSLADVLVYEWPDLFERSQVVTQSLLENAMAIASEKKTVKLKIQTHYMKERFSESRRVHKVDFQHGAPLLDKDGNLAGYVASSRAELIDKMPEKNELRFI